MSIEWALKPKLHTDELWSMLVVLLVPRSLKRTRRAWSNVEVIPGVQTLCARLDRFWKHKAQNRAFFFNSLRFAFRFRTAVGTIESILLHTSPERNRLFAFARSVRGLDVVAASANGSFRATARHSSVGFATITGRTRRTRVRSITHVSARRVCMSARSRAVVME